MKINLSHSKNLIIVFLLIFFTSQTHPQAFINFDSTHQIIRGFGAANILPWRADMTTSEINTAFGTNDGQIGFSILRLRVPSDTNSFSANLNTAALAHSLGITLIASPWSPPASMKTNNNVVDGELKEDSYHDYAAHLKKFTDYMSDNGAPIYAISVQNEPDVSVTYESCDWNASQMLKFVQENAPSNGTKVMAPESFQFRRNLSDPLLNDSTALANFDILAGHIYGGGLAPYPLAEEKGKEVWMTEYLINSGGPPTNLSIDTGWTGAMQTAQSIINCMNANMSAYVWWYIVRYYGPIADGTYATKGDVTKKGFVMSQFARFVRPGFYRVEATKNPQSGVTISAFKDSSRIVIVAINDGSTSKEQTFALQWGTTSSFTPYVTSTTKNCVQESDVVVSNNSFTVNLEPSSITTFVSEGYSEIPVELVSFTANAVGDKVELKWVTASEINDSGFEIQRSVDNKPFSKIGFVEGKGTTTEAQNYFFEDKISADKIYYRLKQIDFDGSFNYSDIVEVSTIPLEYNLLQNYPNPFNPTTTIKYSIPENSNVSLKIFNHLGEQVEILFEGYQEAGNYNRTFDGSRLASGVYFYQLKTDNFLDTKKLMLVK